MFGTAVLGATDGHGDPWRDGTLSAEGSTVGATSWVDSGGTCHIRLYIGNNGRITDYCWDGSSWKPGECSVEGVEASATSWMVDGSIRVRLYVRQSDGNCDRCCDHRRFWS